MNLFDPIKKIYSDILIYKFSIDFTFTLGGVLGALCSVVRYTEMRSVSVANN